MEHAQRANALASVAARLESLNPYFNGTCSKSTNVINAKLTGLES